MAKELWAQDLGHIEGRGLGPYVTVGVPCGVHVQRAVHLQAALSERYLDSANEYPLRACAIPGSSHRTPATFEPL